MLLSAPGVSLAALVLTAPGILWAVLCYPSGSYASRISVGVALGLTFQWHVCALLAAGPGITRLSVAAATGAGLLIASLLAWRRRWTFRLTRIVRHPRHTYLLLLILALATAISAAPLAIHSIPQGWDPSFHVLLASTTIATGHLPTWMPYEQIPLNYPYGPHVFIAEISLLTGIAPDQVFGVLLNLLTPLATGLALYGFARQVWRSPEAALGAVAAYGLLGNWGSLDYGAWGGLPNALGFFLLLAFLQVLFARGHEWTRVAVGGLLLGALPLAHHHVMLTGALLLTTYSACLVVLALLRRRQPIGHIARRQLVRLVLIAVVGFVTVAYYAVPYALRAREIQNSDVLRYIEYVPGLIFDKNGWLLWILALAGIVLGVLAGFQRKRLKRLDQAFRVRQTEALLFTAATSVLLLAFLLGYYGYRAYSLRVYHQPYTAFTPSRFLTDLTYFLAVFAGPPLALLWHWAGSILWRQHPAGQVIARYALRAGLALALVITAVNTIATTQFVPHQGHLELGEAAAFTWIKQHTPANTIVINLDPTNRWAPYFTQREVTKTPVPVSEFTTGYVAEKRYLASLLLSLLGHERLVAFAAASPVLPAFARRPVALLSDSGLPSVWNRDLRFQSGPERVYMMGNAFGQLLQPTSSARWWTSGSAPPANWQTLGSVADWAAQASPRPVAGSAHYLRLTVAGASSPLWVSCAGENGGRVFIDGKAVPDTCSGSWQTFPELTTPGKHVLAFEAAAGQESGSWFDVAVIASTEA